MDAGTDPVYEARAIVGELRKYDESLYDKPRWLILNKTDMLDETERAGKVPGFPSRRQRPDFGTGGAVSATRNLGTPSHSWFLPTQTGL